MANVAHQGVTIFAWVFTDSDVSFLITVFWADLALSGSGPN